MESDVVGEPGLCLGSFFLFHPTTCSHPRSTNASELRLVVMGKTGSGKSATSNTILGDEKFKVSRGASFDSVTKECSIKSGRFDSTSIEIMDTPGLFNTESAQEYVAKKISDGLASWTPGPHAVVLVISGHARFSREDYVAYMTVKKIFGEGVKDCVVVVFTGGDILEERKISPSYFCTSDVPAELRQIMKECENRYAVFNNNNATKNKIQVHRLLDMVQKIKKEKGGFLHTTQKRHSEVESELHRLMLWEEEREAYHKTGYKASQQTATNPNTNVMSVTTRARAKLAASIRKTEGSDIEDWGEQEGLPPETITVLTDQGFTAVDELCDLSPEDITECFQKTGLLPLAKCLALRKAINRLSRSGKTAQAACSVSDPSSAEEPFQNQASPFQLSMSDGGSMEHFRLLLVGRAGSGKSTAGNTIFGKELFSSDSCFGPVTSTCELKRCVRRDCTIEIMDTPDLCDFVQTPDKMATNIVQAVVGMHPGPDAILYVVEMGRYTTEDFGAYQRLKAFFDDSITNFIIVLFTVSDRLIGKNITYDFVDHLPSRLSHVLHECGHRYIHFNNMARGSTYQVEQLLNLVRQIKKQNQGPYACPKYQKIGQRLEEEVAKRLAVADKKELQRQKYVQELEKRMEEAEERLRVQQQQAAEEKQQDEQLKQEIMKHAHAIVLRQTTEATLLRELVERQRQQVMSVLQEQRRKEREALEKREAERGMPDHKRPKGEIRYLGLGPESNAKTQDTATIETFEKTKQKLVQREEQQRKDRKQLEQRDAEERDPEKTSFRELEELKRKERRYNEEMDRMKRGITQNVEQGFISEIVLPPTMAIFNF